MDLFKGIGMKDDTILWFIILFVLLFFCGNCKIGGIGDRDCD
jgi:hypothetical protein